MLHQRDRKIQFAFDKENFIKQFVLLHLILSSLQKVRIARIRLCSFSVHVAKGKSWGREEEESQFQGAKSLHLSPPTARGRARPAPASFWARDLGPAFSLYGASPAAATVTMETRLGCQLSLGSLWRKRPQVGRGLYTAERPRPLRTRVGALCESGAGSPARRGALTPPSSRETSTAPGLYAPKGPDTCPPQLHPSPPAPCCLLAVLP